MLWTCVLNLSQIAAVHLKERDIVTKFRILRYGLLSHALCYKYAQNTDGNLRGIVGIFQLYFQI